MAKTIQIGGRRSGKIIAMEKARDDFIRKNPKATIVTVRGGETIIEKHVEPLGPKLIEYRKPEDGQSLPPVDS